MNFTRQYFEDAQKVIIGVLDKSRPGLLENAGRISHEMKADNSIVTKLDKELEIKLKEALSKFDSTVGFWGEEHGREGSEKNYWLIDPIDGTEAFVRGLDSPRSVLSFVSNDEVEYSLAHRFITDDLYTAVTGSGTHKNGKRIKLSDRPLSRAWLEFSVKMLDPKGYAIYLELRPKIAGITNQLDFLEVLDGAVDGIVVYKSAGQIWDYAPRAHMIKEAGGRVANVGKSTYNIHDLDLVATNSIIFDEIHKILSDLA